MSSTKQVSEESIGLEELKVTTRLLDIRMSELMSDLLHDLSVKVDACSNSPKKTGSKKKKRKNIK